jgi:hypoxanthine-guanine phosphoribosyltransferase
VRHISAHIPDVKVDFVRASSYGKASESGGAVQVAGLSRLSRWSDFHVLLVRGKGSGLDAGVSVAARSSPTLKGIDAMEEREGLRRV